MTQPTLTILTTSFNRKALLEETMKSVLRQDYPAIEHIVIDGGSTDGTSELLKSYEEKYQAKGYAFIWVSEKDSGQAEAMAKGIKKVTGEFLCLLNDDDVLAAPDAVATFMRTFADHPDVDFVYGDNYAFYKDTGRTVLVRYRFYTLDDMLNKGYQIPQCSCIFRTSLMAKVGSFDQKLRHVAEHELFLRFAKAGAKFYYLSEPLQTILEHEGRKTNVAPRSALIETRNVHLRNGASRFSRFYILYLRDRYFGGFFNMLRTRAPGLFNFVKKIFNKATT